jgi:hypothetical protein
MAARWLGLAGLAALLAGGSLLAQDVSVDYDHNFQFNKMKSYSWGNIQISDPKVEPRVVAALDHVIQQYGFNESDKNKKGDVIVTVVEANRPQQYVSFYRGMTNLNWQRGWWGGGGFSDSVARLRQIHGGTLVVDIYDGATGRLVWRGTSAEGAQASDNMNQANVDKTVNTMFARFPPKSGGSLLPNQEEVPPSPSSTPVTSPN